MGMSRRGYPGDLRNIRARYRRAKAAEQWCRARGYVDSADLHRSDARWYLVRGVVRVLTLGLV